MERQSFQRKRLSFFEIVGSHDLNHAGIIMCKCTPEIKTPFCGRGDCQWPKETIQSMQEDRLRRDIEKLVRSKMEVNAYIKASDVIEIIYLLVKDYKK